MSALAKLVIATAGVVLIATSAAVILVPPTHTEERERRNAEAHRLLKEVAEAVERYRRERGHYPPGDGSGSDGLLHALQAPSRLGAPYFPVEPGQVVTGGHLRNPALKGKAIVFYLRRPGGGFRLWAHDASGREAGVSSVDAIVPQP